MQRTLAVRCRKVFSQHEMHCCRFALWQMKTWTSIQYHVLHTLRAHMGSVSTVFSRHLRIVFSFESNLESNRPTGSFSNRIGRCNQTIVVYTLHLQRIFNPSVFCICDERQWCTDYGTPNWVLVYFNSVIKRVKQCCCTLILLSKSTLNANLTTTNRFFMNDNWQRGRFKNFESDHQYKSNLKSDVWFEIESNHEASQVPSVQFTHMSAQKHGSVEAAQ